MSHAQKIADNMNIANTLSFAHAIVKGTKMSLIPPDGFTQASNFNGFHQIGSRSSIMVIEIPGPYNEVSAALTKEGEQFAQGIMFTTYILVFGSEEFTVLINAMFPKEFETEKVVDPLENLSYEIDISGTKLQYGNSISNSLVYTVDGKLPTESNDKTTLQGNRDFYICLE